jgi:prolyl-tRNA synthetase
MRYSNAFIYTKRESSKEAESISHDLSLRAGLVSQTAAGHYTYLPIGKRVLGKIELIVREEMERAGALEIIMPIMQPATLWQESGRWDVYGEEMFKLKSRTDREFCLGPTHEELIVDLVRTHLRLYKELPFTLYQFGTKFRDERRARGGLLRAKEFLMKDAYSFDAAESGLDESYQCMRDAYLRILERVGVTAIPTNANTGEMGGSMSEEFIAPSPAGEDKIIIDESGVARKLEDFQGEMDDQRIQNGIEICHIFKLGTRYSTAMKLNFLAESREPKPVVMGCYGFGVSRCIPTIIEQHHDEKGIIWPHEVAPFAGVIIPIQYDKPEVKKMSHDIYEISQTQSIDILLDDRDLSPGAKFKDADLLGIPFKLIVSERGIASGTVEYERRDGAKERLSADNLKEIMSKLL